MTAVRCPSVERVTLMSTTFCPKSTICPLASWMSAYRSMVPPPENGVKSRYPPYDSTSESTSEATVG